MLLANRAWSINDVPILKHNAIYTFLGEKDCSWFRKRKKKIQKFLLDLFTKSLWFLLLGLNLEYWMILFWVIIWLVVILSNLVLLKFTCYLWKKVKLIFVMWEGKLIPVKLSCSQFTISPYRVKWHLNQQWHKGVGENGRWIDRFLLEAFCTASEQNLVYFLFFPCFRRKAASCSNKGDDFWLMC